MSTYNVDIQEVWTNSVEIESEVSLTKEQILQEIESKLAKGEIEGELEYSHTLDKNEWTVQEIKDTVFL